MVPYLLQDVRINGSKLAFDVRDRNETYRENLTGDRFIDRGGCHACGRACLLYLEHPVPLLI